MTRKTHMFTGGTVPVAVRDDHQRRSETGRVEGSITLVTQKQLQIEYSVYQLNYGVISTNLSYFLQIIKFRDDL